ncbi:hypothetical protein GYMLUDRAFT_253297 [Collybiopsis luxurians FD-317 M1]|uniref:Thioredoxin domain-containing protein n=1 Tax=Collybiopsis luxurians FD-317 M1 TaxID=944289 RepID=A0A0D0BKW1_9AGAR|nr:hypothetical protein GYMLUDRAFT_253297 [Collybiopsis luxurians FD-317 M1]
MSVIDLSLDRCFLLDDALAHQAGMHPNTKFPASSIKWPSRSIQDKDEDDLFDDKYFWDDDDEEDSVDLNMLPTMLVYCDGKLVYDRVRVDRELEGLASRSCSSLANITKAPDEIRTGVTPAMTSDSILAFLIDWT